MDLDGWMRVLTPMDDIVVMTITECTADLPLIVGSLRRG